MTVTTFSELELDENLLEALQDKGFTRPTAIQAAAIPPALDGRDILGSAPTGTGKTAAYLLPALQHLLDFPRKKSGPPRILILTPTRELAMQVADHARELAKHTHLDIATITGGVAYMNHAEVFSENQDIVVATTGRLLQYIKEENFDCRAVETLILDEADRMLDMGFAQDIETIAGETRWRKQTMLFSATLEGDAIKDFAERLLEEPVEVSANPSTRERKKIHQWYYRADDIEHKTKLLVNLLQQPEATRAIVFVRKRERVHELANWLREAGINTCWLEGEMVQAKRNEAIKRLTDGRVNVLIATDVAARGIDIPDVSHVFNFDMPRTADTYLHRIGRTGRAGKKGTAISLVEAHDHLLLGKIGRYIEEPLKARVIDELRPTTRAPSEKLTGKPSKKVLAKRAQKKKDEKEKPRVKKRHRDTKNIGKRRKPSAAGTPSASSDEKKKRRDIPAFSHLALALQAFGKGTGDNVALLFRRQRVEAYRVAGNTNGQLRIFFRMLNRVQQGFATQHVNVQVLTAFDAHFRFHVHRDFTVFDFTQFAYRNHIIFRKTTFGAQAARFAFFAIQQPERVEQVVVCRFSNLDTSNHLMPPRQCLFDFGLFAANW